MILIKRSVSACGDKIRRGFLYLIGDDFENINSFLVKMTRKIKLIFKKNNYLLNQGPLSDCVYKLPAEMHVIPPTARMTPIN